MIKQLKSLAIFAEVVDCGSFREAARRLDLSPSIVSNHISQLEEEVGAALLYRSTRSLVFTREGKQLYKFAADMVTTASNGLMLFSDSASDRLVELRLAAPVTLTTHPVFDKIVEFAELNQAVRINLISSDTQSDLVKDGIDVAIRMGRFRDSDYKSRTIGKETLTLVAAPNCLNRYSSIRTPAHLEALPFISFAPVDDAVQLSKPGRKVEKVWGDTAAITDSVESMRRLAIAGVGLAALPSNVVRNDIEQGTLKKVLPGWTTQELPVVVVWPKNAVINSVTRAFIDFVSGK